MQAILLLLLLSADTDQARPDAVLVAANVDQSREQNRPTKADHLDGLRKQIQRLKSQRAQFAQISDARIRRREVGAIDKRIRALNDQIRKDEKDWQPPDLGSVGLSRIEWGKLKIGGVGRATLKGAAYTFRCEQILGEESALITVLADGKRLTTVRIDHRSTDGDQEGLACQLEADVVVVGRFTYAAVDGSQRTVFVLEVFNPNVPFN